MPWLPVQLLKRRCRLPFIVTVQCISPLPFLCLRAFWSSHKFALFWSFALNAEIPGQAPPLSVFCLHSVRTARGPLRAPARRQSVPLPTCPGRAVAPPPARPRVNPCIAAPRESAATSDEYLNNVHLTCARHRQESEHFHGLMTLGCLTRDGVPLAHV
jgi:hypothetical protein